MEELKIFKNLLSSFCINIYKQDFPQSLIHFGQSVSEQRCETWDDIQKLILKSSGYIIHLYIKIF